MLKRIWLLAILVGLGVSVVSADERRFAYNYEADTLPQGHLEFENWVTLRTGKENGHYSRWDLRHEVEYGLTDHLSTALYFNMSQKDTVFSFEGLSSEWKYLISSPLVNPVGVLVYGEARYSGQELELEEKLVLQRNQGNMTYVANISFEQEWAYTGNTSTKESVFEVTAGAAYKLNPNWTVALEARQNSHYTGLFMSDYENVALFVGPTISYSDGKFWTAFSVQPQIYGDPKTKNNLELHDHESMEVRWLTGIVF
ncbi:MAG: hypothetical protein EXS67_05060 [Candidatus Margulisbacteria bacterium]|nr:hypothetical protein [Candidatus Margulisiibacteriota bacterium]